MILGNYDKELKEMTWSFSRVNGFGQCKYYWYLNYLEKREKEDNVYSLFGKFGHKILEMYANDELTKKEMVFYYKEYFKDEVSDKMVDISEEKIQKYYELGLSYFENCDLVLTGYDILGVELECHYDIDGISFIGFIDLLLRDKETGDIFIIDHKSSEFPLGKKGGILKKKEKDYMDYKRQLYLYAQPVYDMYGVYPKEIQWNYFKERKWLKLPFVLEEFEEAKKWAIDTIKVIYEEDEFIQTEDYFYCRNLCNFRGSCEYRKLKGGD